MEKIEFISGYFEIYSEFSLILKMNESQFKKDPKSPPSDPFSISLHHFLGQVIAFMIIFISDYKKRLKLDKFDKIQQKLEKKKRKIFDEIFPKCADPEYNYFDYDTMIKLLIKAIDINLHHIPILFQMEDYLKPIYLLELPKRLKEALFQKLWKNVSISALECADPQNGLDHLHQIDPGILGELFENQQHKIQRKTLQQGVFYSPIAEIKFTILDVILNHVFSDYKEPLDEKKETISACICNLMDDSDPKNHQDGEIIEILYSKLDNFKILDPSCGSGSFLVHFQSFWLHLLIHNNIVLTEKDKMPEFVGMDVNPWSILITDFRLWLQYYHMFPKSVIKWHNSKKFLCTDFLIPMTKSILLHQKYDFIIGNPPYIRNRDIKNPNLYRHMENQEYRGKIRESLEMLKLSEPLEIKRFDYYLYFYLHSFQKLKPNGILGFIVSNSWMSVKFGYSFHSYICKYMKILNISESLFRSFSSADVNTVISIFQNIPRSNRLEDITQNRTKFIQWKLSYTKLLETKNYSDIARILLPACSNEEQGPKDRENYFFKINDHELSRILLTSQEAMLIGPERTKSTPLNLMYKGYNWMNYFFKAPPLYYELLGKLGDFTIFLHDIASIRRGITTNCNEFFVLTHTQDQHYRNGYGDIFKLPGKVLRPFLNSPKDLHTSVMDSSKIKTYLFYTKYSKNQLHQKKMNHVLDYIRYGESKHIKIKKGTNKGKIIQGVQNLASFKHKYQKNPDTWFCSTSQYYDPPLDPSKLVCKKIIIQKIFNTSYKIALIDSNIIPNNTFYEISPKDAKKLSEKLLFSLLLGSLSFLSIELQGRTNFGGGALDTATFDIGKIILVDPHKYSENQKKNIIKYAAELSLTQIERAEVEFKKSMRRNLDKILISKFTVEASLPELYESILKIQNQRTKRSKTYM